MRKQYFSGSGNLFTIINNTKTKETLDFFAKNIQLFCYNDELQKTMDGLIVINPSAEYDFSVWFFNPDGTSEMMCGNGGRCALYYFANYIANNYKNNITLTFSMNKRLYSGKVNDDNVSIFFEPPRQLPLAKNIKLDNNIYDGVFVDVGTPHWITEVTTIKTIDIQDIGRSIRFHKTFAPEGTNVNFFQVENSNTILLRTYERGVEAETGACGTGSIATALAFFCKYNWPDILTIIPTSQSPLTIELVFKPNFDKKLTNITQIILSGKCQGFTS